MVDVGYVSLELGECQLVFKEDPVPEGENLSLCVDLELLQESDLFKWQINSSTVVSSEVLVPFKLPPAEEPAKEEESAPAAAEEETAEKSEDAPHGEGDDEAEVAVVPPVVYSVGLNNFFKRTEFIDLSNEALASFTNASIKVKVREASAGEGDGDGAEAKPPLCEMIISLSSVLMSAGGSVSAKSSLEVLEAGSDKNLVATDSFISYILTTDNDMTEFCLGCGVYKWDAAVIKAPPVQWSLHYEDVVDPKAKAAPTEEDLRTAYLGAIANLVSTQNDVVAYQMEIGKQPVSVEAVAEGDGEEVAAEGENAEKEAVPGGDTDASLLPFTVLADGRMGFDSEAAASVDIAEDIRARSDLWTLNFASSKAVFLHRSQMRELASSLLSGASNPTMTVTLKKIPTEAGAAAEGEEIVAVGTVDLASLVSPGLKESSLQITDLSGSGFSEVLKEVPSGDVPVEGKAETAAEETKEGGEEAEAAPIVLVTPPDVGVLFSISTPIVAPKPSVEGIIAESSVVSSGRSIHSAKERDVLKELKDEITECVRQIAVEYVSKYPVQDPSDMATAKGDGDMNAKGLEDKKIEFLHYLSSSGVYHRLKEGLKPRIQRVFRAEFGARGQAKGGKTPSFQDEGMEKKVSSDSATTDQVLAELYVYLVKVCNQVLNKLYSSTVIDKDTSDVDKGATVDDEEESNNQKLLRLFNQAVDAEADGRIADAEQRLLERLQLVKFDTTLANDSLIQYDAYHKLAEFYLRQASASTATSVLFAKGDEVDSSVSSKYVSRAREALSACVEFEPTEWKARQELACLFDEAGLTRQAEDMMIAVINDQINSGTPLQSFGNEFDGYESDSICHVSPQSYAILAAHFSRSGLPLKARKCIRLASKAFVEMGVQPTTDMHGSPRRTPVLILAQAAVWLCGHGFVKLASECVILATQCEDSTNTKAKARNLNSVTPAFIRHALKRAVAEVGLLTPGTESAEDFARDSVTCSEDAEDMINGWLCVAKASKGALTDSLLSAIEVGNGHGLMDCISLACYLEVIKQLVALGRFEDALPVALTAAKIYHTSSSLMLQVGVISLRLGQVEDAERALREANLLDNRNCEVWAYQCLICLQGGPRREQEATAALHQTLRLGLASPAILRELSTGFMASDKLQVAEELIRRSINAEGGKGSFTTRKLLGDVLAGQNLAAKAVEEYKAVLGSTGFESDAEYPKVQLAAAERCVSLLQSLGRDEEAKSASAIAIKLRSTL